MIGCGVISGWKSAKSVTLRDTWKRKSPSDEETKEREIGCANRRRLGIRCIDSLYQYESFCKVSM